MKKLKLLSVIGMFLAVPVLSATNVFRMAKAGDMLWVTTNEGVSLCSLDGNQVVTYTLESLGLPENVSFYGVAVNGENDVWFGSTGNCVGHYDGDGFQLNDAPARMCRVVDVDTDGMLWVGASERGLMSYDGSKWEIYEIESISSSLFSQAVKADESDGLVWSVMSNGGGAGFGYHDSEGWHSVSLASEDFKQDTGDSFSSLEIAADGSKWLGLYHGQVCHFKNVDNYSIIELSKVARPELYSSWAKDVQVGPDGRVWAACLQSLYAIDCNYEVEEMEIPLAEGDGEITCFCHDGDAIWIGTSKGGLLRWSPLQLEHINISAGFSEIAAPEAVDDVPTFDIMGRRVKCVTAGNLYIKAGHKFIIR